MKTNDDGASPIPVLPWDWEDGVQLKTVSVFLLGPPTMLGSRWDMQTTYCLFLVLKRRTFHG